LGLSRVCDLSQGFFDTANQGPFGKAHCLRDFIPDGSTMRGPYSTAVFRLSPKFRFSATFISEYLRDMINASTLKSEPVEKIGLSGKCLKWKNASCDETPANNQAVLISVAGVYYLTTFDEGNVRFVLQEQNQLYFHLMENGEPVYWVPIDQAPRTREEY
jgi:hypothetical protein